MSLLRHHFVDSNARYKRILLGKFLRLVEIVRLDDRVTRNGFHIHWQGPGSAFRYFSAIAEMPTLVDHPVGDRFEPGPPGLHDFRSGFYKSEMQINKLFHFSLLVDACSRRFAGGWGLADPISSRSLISFSCVARFRRRKPTGHPTRNSPDTAADHPTRRA